MNRANWKNPTVQAEFAAWTGRLQGLGIDIEQPEFEDRLWDFASSFNERRNQAIKPFFTYYRCCGTWQSWRMFVAPHRNPGRLRIDLLTDRRWSPIYEARSAEYEWRRRQFDNDRLRSAIFRFAWSGTDKKYRRYYHEFVDWVAQRAAEDFPEARSVRVRFFRYETLSPEAARDGALPEGEYELGVVRPLAKYRKTQ